MTRPNRWQNGISLIEIMVGMAVAMLASLIIVQVFSVSDGYKRATTGGSDAQQQAAILGYFLNTAVSTAGSGLSYTQSFYSGLSGCPVVSATAGSGPAFPLTGLSGAFASFPTTPKIMPAGIIDGGGTAARPRSDIIQLFSGNASANNAAQSITLGAGGNTTLSLTQGALGYRPGDFLVVFDRQQQNTTVGTVTQAVHAASGCQILKVASTYATGANDASTTANFGGAAINSVVNGSIPLDTGFGSVNTGALTADIKLAANFGNAPRFIALGVDEARATLQQLNLLTNDNATVAENVITMQALYGLANAAYGRHVPDANWVKPEANYAYAQLDGSVAGTARIAEVRAIRIAIVMRGSQRLSGQTSPATVALFNDLRPSNLAIDYTLTAAERAFPVQVYDFVIQLRN